MGLDWRRRALAALAAAAVGLSCAVGAVAQAPAKKAVKKARSAEDGRESTAKGKQDPAAVQRTIETAAKLLEAGKADDAVQSLTNLLSAGKLPPALMAKALHLRGIGYRKQGKPAQAISDLTSALWLKNALGESDRADAMKQRAAAYAEAGLSETGEAIAAVPPSASGRTKERTPSASTGWSTNITAQPAPSDSKQSQGGSSGQQQAGGFDLFNSIFGLGPASPPQQSRQSTGSITKAEPESAAAPARQKMSSSWSQNTEVRSAPVAASASAAAAASRPAEAAPAPRAKPDGKFRLQLGMARTQQEAEAIAAKVRREYATVLADRLTEIDQAVVGNMGTFYRVRLGPYATQQEGQAACAQLRGSGLDCLIVTQ